MSCQNIYQQLLRSDTVKSAQASTTESINARLQDYAKKNPAIAQQAAAERRQFMQDRPKADPRVFNDADLSLLGKRIDSHNEGYKAYFQTPFLQSVVAAPLAGYAAGSALFSKAPSVARVIQRARQARKLINHGLAARTVLPAAYSAVGSAAGVYQDAGRASEATGIPRRQILKDLYTTTSSFAPGENSNAFDRLLQGGAYQLLASRRNELAGNAGPVRRFFNPIGTQLRKDFANTVMDRLGSKEHSKTPVRTFISEANNLEDAARMVEQSRAVQEIQRKIQEDPSLLPRIQQYGTALAEKTTGRRVGDSIDALQQLIQRNKHLGPALGNLAAQEAAIAGVKQILPYIPNERKRNAIEVAAPIGPATARVGSYASALLPSTGSTNVTEAINKQLFSNRGLSRDRFRSFSDYPKYNAAYKTIHMPDEFNSVSPGTLAHEIGHASAPSWIGNADSTVARNTAARLGSVLPQVTARYSDPGSKLHAGAAIASALAVSPQVAEEVRASANGVMNLYSIAQDPNQPPEVRRTAAIEAGRAFGGLWSYLSTRYGPAINATRQYREAQQARQAQQAQQ